MARPPRAPTSPALRWSRRLELLGAFLLQLSPFFIWAQVPFLGLVVWVPGLFLQGVAMFGIGTLVITMLLFGVRHPFGMMALGALAGGTVLWERHQILTHTDELMARVQASFDGMNAALTTVHLSPVTVAPTGWAPEQYLGHGLLYTFIAALLVLLGGLLELAGHAYSKDAVSVLIGLPRCRFCHVRVAYAFDYCPGCGRRQVPGHPCGQCGQWLQDEFQYCTACGTHAPPDAASVRDLVVPLGE